MAERPNNVSHSCMAGSNVDSFMPKSNLFDLLRICCVFYFRFAVKLTLQRISNKSNKTVADIKRRLGAQFAATVQSQAWHVLANMLEIYDYLLQHGAYELYRPLCENVTSSTQRQLLGVVVW